MIDRIVTPIVALGLAFLVWIYMRSRDQEVLDNYPVAVEVQVVPTQVDLFQLEVNGPTEVRVSFTGPPSRIREQRGMLQRGEVRVIRKVTVPEERLNDPRYLDVIRVDASEVPVLPGVQAIIAEKQNRIPLVLRRLIEKQLTVKVQHTGGDRVEQVVVEPQQVRVLGPKEVLEREEFITTRLLMIPAGRGLTERVVDTTDALPILEELSGQAIKVTPSAVQVRMTLRPQQRVHELVDVPVHFLCPAGFAFRPQFTSPRAGSVTLRVLGPALEQRPTARAYVDLALPGRQYAAGLYAEEPIRVQLPHGFELLQDSPKISVELVQPTSVGRAEAGGLVP